MLSPWVRPCHGWGCQGSATSLPLSTGCALAPAWPHIHQPCPPCSPAPLTVTGESCDTSPDGVPREKNSDYSALLWFFFFFFASETEILTLKTEILCRGNNLGESKPRPNQKVRLSAKHTTSASEAQHSPALPFSDRNTNRVFKALNKKLHKYQTPDLYPNKTLHCTHFPLGDGEKTKQTCVGAAGHCSGRCCRKGLCWAVLSPPTASQHSRVCTFVGAHTACLEHIIQG